MAETTGVWCRIQQVSERAVWIKTDDGRTVSLPLSQVDLPGEQHWGGVVLLDVPEWLAIDRGLV